jgi:hypothetical protein
MLGRRISQVQGLGQGLPAQNEQPDRQGGRPPEAALAMNVDVGTSVAEPISDFDQLLRRRRVAVRNGDVPALDAESFHARIRAK